MTTTADNVSAAATNGDAKKTRTRKPIEGVRISFVISQDRYNKLDAAAKADLRTADNLAMVATTKYCDNLDSPTKATSAGTATGNSDTPQHNKGGMR